MENVLIVGAGPTGLVLALWLTQQGIKVRIIDKSTGPGETSRALGVQARTLELYRQLDLAEEVAASGNKNFAINLWVGGKRKAQVSFGQAGASITPYPYVLIYPQDLHERVLVEKLQSMGVSIERETELIGFSETENEVGARLRLPDGSEENIRVSYLAGCDGARSTVRTQLGSGFAGGTYKQVFYVADAEVSGLEPADQVHLALDTSDFIAVFSYAKNGQVRIIGTVKDERADRAETLTFQDVSHEAIDRLPMQVNKVNWFSTYRVHHRLADRFRFGRIFLLGDAAHIHSPAGAQGMNTGIGDAINLAWKMAAVLNGQAPDELLDSYQTERQTFARKLVHTTDKIFTFVSADGTFANFVRMHIAPFMAGFAGKFESVREVMFRLVSQTSLNYKESPLSEGRSGSIEGGERLPWVKLPGADNYEPLRQIEWQVHIYGKARDDVREWCAQRNLPLHVFDWDTEYGKAGFAEDAAYLLRPDTYVALAESDPTYDKLENYFSSRGYNCRM